MNLIKNLTKNKEEIHTEAILTIVNILTADTYTYLPNCIYLK
jgi:hypothetical protein